MYGLPQPFGGRAIPASLLGLGGVVHQISADVVQLFFGGLVAFVARLDQATLARLWQAISTSTAPVLSGQGWARELETMSLLGAELVLPLLLVAVIQAIVRQDAGGLARTAFLKVPLALLFTAAVAEIVSLGLKATDQACASLLHASGRSVGLLFSHIETTLGPGEVGGLAANFLFLSVAGVLAFIVWLELAVRGAAVAVAVLFLPLALAGSALPATSHWARRLGETLTALVLSKLAIVAVLSLAVSALGSAAGFSSLTEGLTLLALSAVAPLALARLLPMVEAGAVAQLEGIGRRSVQKVATAVGGPEAWLAGQLSGARPGSSSAPSPPAPQPPPPAPAEEVPASRMPPPRPARPLS